MIRGRLGMGRGGDALDVERDQVRLPTVSE
jgi:hypothetical protein